MLLFFGIVLLGSSNNGSRWSCHALSLSARTTSSSSQQARIFSRIPVLKYENNWTCVNKPCGLTLHQDATTRRNKQPTLVGLVKRQLARKTFPVHRLDHRTSGAVLLAFDSETCAKLHLALRKSNKIYVALLRGDWYQTHNNVTTVTSNVPLNVHGVEKEAITQFTILASHVHQSNDEYSDTINKSCSLVLVEPITGRTHQIRRHARAMGQPVLGDTAHGNSRVNRYWRTKWNLNRLALHCFSIKDLRLDHEKHEIVAPLPLEFKRVLERFPEMWSTALEREPRLLMHPVDIKGGTHGRNYRKRKQHHQELQN